MITNTATIANGQSLSVAISLSEGRREAPFTLSAIIMSVLWTAASLTFQVSANGTDFFDLYNPDGTEYEVQAGASRCINLDPTDFMGYRSFKIRSGTSGTPVAQSAERALTLIVAIVN